MSEKPRTYGRHHHPEDPERCIAPVSNDWNDVRQCIRKRAIAGLYCKQHDPAARAAKAALRHEKWKAATDANRARVRRVELLEGFGEACERHGIETVEALERILRAHASSRDAKP